LGSDNSGLGPLVFSLWGLSCEVLSFLGIFFFGREIGLGPLVFSLFGLIFCFYLAYLVEFSSFLCVPLTEWVKFEIFGLFFLLTEWGKGRVLCWPKEW
jgi:hypothetical protein